MSLAIAATLHRGRAGWLLLPLAVAATVALPVAFVAVHIFFVPGEILAHLASTVLPRYLASTVALLAGTLSISLVFGATTAWLVTACEFPGRRVLEWGLTLPIALPAYISAFAYVGIFSYGGTLQTLLGTPAIDMMNLAGASFVLGASLYPYVYLTARAAFAVQSATVLEVARSLSAGSATALRRLVLPLARPALVAGLSLVAMECLSDYGAASYYGIDTLGTAILRTWLSRGNAAEAAHLAAWLLLLVAGLLAVERRLRGGARYSLPRAGGRPAVRARLSGPAGVAAAAACALPLLAGFGLPVAQLVRWALLAGRLSLSRMLAPMLNSLMVAVVASVIVLLLALLLAYGRRTAGGALHSMVSRLATLGYAVPGSVLALGVVIPLAWLDHRVADVAERLTGRAAGLALSGTLVALVGALVTRFLAVAFQPLEAGFERSSRQAGEVSLSLGHAPLETLRRIEVPLLRGPLTAAALIVFLEVIKELPLTLILRPFNFHTLATRTYQLAGDERVAASAPLALAMVAIGTVGVYVLNRMSRGRQ